MGKMHELLAVEADHAAVADKVLKEAINTFSKKEDHFMGQTRSVTMFDEKRQQGEDVSETKELVTTVMDKIAYVSDTLVKHWDVVFQKEATNQQATAELVVGGVVLLKNLPATFLLGMEGKVKRFREMVEHVPTLSPGIKWEKDPDTGAGAWRWCDEKVSFKTEKTVKHKILDAATQYHKAQIETWNEDVPVGRISVRQTSGMLSPAEKSALLERIDNMLRAVKEARQRANSIDAVNDRPIQAVMDYMLKG